MVNDVRESRNYSRKQCHDRFLYITKHLKSGKFGPGELYLMLVSPRGPQTKHFINSSAARELRFVENFTRATEVFEITVRRLLLILVGY